MKRRRTEPRLPSRVRLHRPDLWQDDVTGQLKPDCRDFYVGLGTVADDEGMLPWRPAAIGAVLYSYDPPRGRLSGIERRAVALQAAGLLVIEPCGCARLPRMERDFRQAGGVPVFTIRDWHEEAHAPEAAMESDVTLRSTTSDYGSVSGSVTESVPVSESEGEMLTTCPRCGDGPLDDRDGYNVRREGRHGQLAHLPGRCPPAVVPAAIARVSA